MQDPLEILVVEPHRGMRASLRGVLAVEDRLHVAGEAPDVLAALRLADRVPADVAIVDDRLAALRPGSSSETIAALARRVPVVVIGMGEPEIYTRAFLDAGAFGYWCKAGDVDDLIALLRAAAPTRRRAA